MKPIASLLGLFVLNLLILQCKSETKDIQKVEIIDTVFVQDTNKVVEKQAFASASKMNILYRGVRNPIHLDLVGLDPNEIQVEFLNGSGQITKGTGTNYNAFVNNGKEAILRISAEGFSKDFVFRIKSVPDPIAYIPNKDGYINNRNFNAVQGLIAKSPFFNFDIKFIVAKFSLTKISKNSNPIEVKNISARFTSESKQLIRSAMRGDIFIFSKIEAVGTEGNIRNLNSIVIRIK